MIPDKIYISQGLSKEAVKALSLYLNDKDICYIRKEAILEWAKERLKFYEGIDETFDGSVFLGHRQEICELINHIESL